MTTEARRFKRGVHATLLALAFTLIAAAPMAQADTIYPINQLDGATFDNGSADGFSATAAGLHVAALAAADHHPRASSAAS